MLVRWFGQSAFLLVGQKTVFIDPFGDMSGAAARGIQFGYPPIEGVTADLVLVTHEHGDHNGIDFVGGSPVVLRSTAGRLDSPLGEVVAVASEHDDVAGTARGPNTIFCFSLEGLRVCHLGDFGQPALRPEQREAIGAVDVLFVPVGGPRSAVPQPPCSCVRSRLGSSCRCITGRLRSTSSSRRMNSSTRSGSESNGSTRTSSSSRTCSGQQTPRRSRWWPRLLAELLYF